MCILNVFNFAASSTLHSGDRHIAEQGMAQNLPSQFSHAPAPIEPAKSFQI
jgi:hypothetical protein